MRSAIQDFTKQSLLSLRLGVFESYSGCHALEESRVETDCSCEEPWPHLVQARKYFRGLRASFGQVADVRGRRGQEAPHFWLQDFPDRLGRLKDNLVVLRFGRKGGKEEGHPFSQFRVQRAEGEDDLRLASASGDQLNGLPESFSAQCVHRPRRLPDQDLLQAH